MQQQHRALVATVRELEARLLCSCLQAAMAHPLFPRHDVSPEAKQNFLDTTLGAAGQKQEWSGVKNAVKQLCGGKRKTGAGRSLGRPPDYSPWESNFDSRSLAAF
jgi:hypothetical protein